MGALRTRRSPEFKLRAVLEVLKGTKTASQITGELEVHPMALSEWKKQLLDLGPQIFAKPNRSKNAA